jgi:hypothetical protein
LDFGKNVSPPLEPKLLVMLEKIVEALKWCIARLPICKNMVLAPLGGVLYSVKRFTVFSLSYKMLTIGAKGSSTIP